MALREANILPLEGALASPLFRKARREEGGGEWWLMGGNAGGEYRCDGRGESISDIDYMFFCENIQSISDRELPLAIGWRFSPLPAKMKDLNL